MDSQVLTLVTNILNTEGWSKYAILTPAIFGLAQLFSSYVLMPSLNVPEANSNVFYRIFYNMVAAFTGNFGKNKPVPVSALKNPPVK